MKVKEFLEYFEDFDPESELKIDLFDEKNLFDEKIDVYWNYQKFTPLDVADVNYLDETDTVFMTLEWGD